MTNVEALKALYVALGGNADDVAGANSNAELIAALAGVMPESGATLPEVTAADNGKALTVASGKWAATDIGETLPEVTTSDNGKILTVVNGEWAAVSPTP